MSKVAVIGAGVGGLGAAIRLAKLGLDVTVFEANDNVGGKINNLALGAYRFDMGPSVFTGPEYIEQLYDLCGEDFNTFEYKKLPQSFHYFFQDGTKLILPAEIEGIAQEFKEKLEENPDIIKKYLQKSKGNYEHIAPLFIESSLHRIKHLINNKLLSALLRIPKYRLNSTMHQENSKTFKNPKTTQIFNRYATYNGSDPYQTPAMLNMIQHLEMNVGIFLPKNGMVQIAHSLRDLALKQGVTFKFNEKVSEIHLENQKVKGVRTSKGDYSFDYVFSNMDVSHTYEKLMPNAKRPEKTLAQEKSSSTMVFYWGIKDTFEQLGVHNMFFSDDYKAEFDAIFKSKTLTKDPSIYVHISSKELKDDAPEGKENWFTMINVPINNGQDWGTIRKEAKATILKKLSSILGKDIAPLIEEEFVMDPVFIEEKYSGKAGSIYGNSSNNKFAAFYRHPNFSKTIEGLYFVGVTVHPGGGIPLALNSAKIAVSCLEEDFGGDLITD